MNSGLFDRVKKVASRVGLTLDRATLIVAIGFTVLFAIVAVAQLRFPYEIDWYEGVMMDHAARIMDGKPIYAAPTADFVAALYQPLYYFLVASAIKVVGWSYVAGRAVTVLASLLTALTIAMSVRRLRPMSRYAIIIAVGFYFSMYAVSDYALTLARIDSVLVLFLVAGVYFASRANLPGAILSSVCLVLAFFTKQQANFYLLLPPIWLFLHSRRLGFVSVAIVLIGLAAGTLLFHNAYGSWYEYYVYAIPAAKGKYFAFSRVFKAVPMEIVRHWGLAILVIGAYYFQLATKRLRFKDREGLWVGMLLVAILQLCMHRGDVMSAGNVLLPIAAFVSVVLADVADRIRHSDGALAPALRWAVLMQLALFFYDPLKERLIIPTAEDRVKSEGLLQFIADTRGDVLLPDHGFLPRMAGKRSHAHIQCINDITVMRDAAQRSLDSMIQEAYDEHQYDAVVIDDSPLRRIDTVRAYEFHSKLPVMQVPASRVGSLLIQPLMVYVPKVAPQ